MRCCIGKKSRGFMLTSRSQRTFAKPIRSTVTTHERADGCRSIVNPCRWLGPFGSDRQVLKARPNHRDVSTRDFIDRNLWPRQTLLSPTDLIKSRSTIRRPIKMKKYLILTASAALFAAAAGLCSAQSDAPYTEGPVWNITMVKAKYGMGDEYLKGLAKTFKGTLDEAKKENLILDYKILPGDAATPH